MKKILLTPRGLKALKWLKNLAIGLGVVYCLILIVSIIDSTTKVIDAQTLSKGCFIVIGAFFLQSIVSMVYCHHIHCQTLGERRNISSVCYGGILAAIFMLFLSAEGVCFIAHTRYETQIKQQAILDDIGVDAHSYSLVTVLDAAYHDSRPLDEAEILILSMLQQDAIKMERLLWYLACMGFVSAEFAIAGLNIALIELPTKLPRRIYDS